MSRRREPPRDPVTRCGSNARCPNGHQRVVLSFDRDGRGKYLDVRCEEPGCGAREQISREDLG